MNTPHSIIITGFGLSGCLLTRMLLQQEHPFFSLIIIDEQFLAGQKHLCFLRNEFLPEEFIKRSWSKISMRDHAGEETVRQLQNESYKLLDWEKLHADTLKLCHDDKRVILVKGKIDSIEESTSAVVINTVDGSQYKGDKLFNSISLNRAKSDLVQQFKGAIVEFNRDVFDPSQVSLMDFHHHAPNGNVEFRYELPFSPRKALVEYTVITSKPLSPEELDSKFKTLLGVIDHKKTVSNEETGAIPMPSQKHYVKNTRRILNIGIAGGFQRRSSGYLLQTIHDQVKDWLNHALPDAQTDIKKEYLKEYLDTVFLSVLKCNPSQGQALFLSMFKETTGDQFLRFMFNPATLKSILPIVLSLPKAPFIKHAAINFKSFF